MRYTLPGLMFFVFLATCSAREKPNIILIFSDDAGYADFGFHGSQVMKTPGLDQLARTGILSETAY